MLTFASVILGLSLFVLSIIIVVKKVFIGLKGSDNGAINIALIALCLLGMFCSFSLLYGVLSIHSWTTTLSTDKFLTAEAIDNLKRNIAETKRSNLISLIIGYISLGLDYVVYRIIDKKHKEELAKEKKHWDFDRM